MQPLRKALQIDIQPLKPNELPKSAGSPSADSATAESTLPTLDFISSDETLDRYGEVICAAGWRLETYRRNPVFQNAHQYGDILFTLGKALITEVRSLPLVTRPSPRATVLYQRIQFATDVNPIARVAYGLYKAKFLNAVSVGFLPLRWQEPDGTEHCARKSADPSSQSHSFQHLSLSPSQAFKRRYLEQELLEVSAVGIPANPNALALGLKAGAIEKSDLREALQHLLMWVAGRQQNLAGSLPIRHHELELFRIARELHRILRSA